MVNLLNVFFTYIFLISMSACFDDNDSANKKFVEKYGNEVFDDFINKSFFVRGNDENKDPIILIYDYSFFKKPCGFAVFTVNNKNQTVKKTSKTLYNDSCEINIDEKTTNQTLQFIKYDINYLEVDANKNVSIKVIFKGEGQADLIRFSDLKSHLSKINF